MINRQSVRNGVVLGLVAACAAGTTAALALFVPASGGSAAPPVTKGTIPASAMANRAVDWSQAPDYVSVVSNGTVVGYVNKADLVPPAPGQPIPGRVASAGDQPPAAADRPQTPVVTVYASDLVTVVGHEVPGRGFVPVGVDPATVPPLGAPTASSAPTGS